MNSKGGARKKQLNGKELDGAAAATPTPRKRMTEKQKKILVEYMVSHGIFAKSGLPPGPNSNVLAARMWEKLVGMLNANGPPRSLIRWKKTWAEWKLRVKRKAAVLYNTRVTGNKDPAEEDDNNESDDDIGSALTEHEEAIYQLCGTTDFIGASEIEEVGHQQKRGGPSIDPLQNEPVSNNDLQPHESEVILIDNGDVRSLPQFVLVDRQAEKENIRTEKNVSPDKENVASPIQKTKKRRMDSTASAEAMNAYIEECAAMSNAMSANTEALKDITSQVVNACTAMTEAINKYTETSKENTSRLVCSMSNLAQAFNNLATSLNSNIL